MRQGSPVQKQRIHAIVHLDHHFEVRWIESIPQRALGKYAVRALLEFVRVSLVMAGNTTFGREQRKKSGEESSSRAKSCGDQHAEKGPRNYFDFGVRGPYSSPARHDLDPVHAHDHHVTDLHIRCAYNMDHIPPRLADGSFVAYD